MNRSGLGRPAVAAALLSLIASGCGPDPAASPTPQPSPTPRPSLTETGAERRQRLDFEAAEKSYRAFRAEYERVLAAGGAKQPTKVMKATAGGPYLAEFERVIPAYAKLGYVQKGTEKIVFVRHGGYSPESLILDVCEDGRKLRVYDSDGKLYGRGEIRTATITVRKVDGRWKLWSGDGEKVTSCP